MTMKADAKPETDGSLPLYAMNILALAAQAGLSRAELARRAKISPHAIYSYTSGKTPPPDETVYRIADLFRVEPTEIDPDRHFARKKGPYGWACIQQPYKISDASNGDPDLVHFTAGMDMRHGTVARFLELIDPARRFTRKNGVYGWSCIQKPYKISGSSNRDPDLVYFTVEMDMGHGTTARVLELIIDERTWQAERDAAERMGA
jgi:transcriptional regulator with XRE-family HTH domain